METLLLQQQGEIKKIKCTFPVIAPQETMSAVKYKQSTALSVMAGSVYSVYFVY